MRVVFAQHAAAPLSRETAGDAALVLLVVVMVLLLVHMLLLARRGSATRLETRVASI